MVALCDRRSVEDDNDDAILACLCAWYVIVDKRMIASLFVVSSPPARPSLLRASLSGCVRRQPSGAMPPYGGLYGEARLCCGQLRVQGAGVCWCLRVCSSTECVSFSFSSTVCRGRCVGVRQELHQ